MDEYMEIVRRAAKETEELFRTGVVYRVHFYFKPGEIKPFADGVEAGKGWELAFSEAMSSAVPYSHYFTFIHDRARRTPCLTGEEEERQCLK